MNEKSFVVARQCVAALILVAIASLIWPYQVSAIPQMQPKYRLEQSDTDGDGKVDLAIFRCAFASDEGVVSVYDGADDMQLSTEWNEATDFINDVWVFDAGGDGTTELIIRFIQESGDAIALLYDDQDQDRQVAYKVTGKEIVLEKPDLWSLKVVAEGGWFLPDGYPNQNLRFYFDGNEELVTGIRDYNHDGVPDYEFWNVYGEPGSTTKQWSRPGLWVNKGTTRPAVPEDTLFWPFLIAGEWPNIDNKFDSTPFIVVDWKRATIVGTSIGKDVSGYPIEEGYFILPTTPLWTHEDNYVNFENPMAYYDLAMDKDGNPELHIRHTYYGREDPHFDFGPIALPFNEVRYSWNQQNMPGLFWDHKIGLVGTNLVATSVHLEDFDIQTVPYEQLPDWVFSQDWGWATFVVRETGHGSPSSEGLYEWPAGDMLLTDASLPTDDPSKYTAAQWLLRGYITGLTDDPPDQYYSHIAPGLRGEFAYLHARNLSLYFSPIDSSLHLSWANHGIWNLDRRREIRYANRNSDPYLDEWQYFENGQLRRQLSVSKQYLILSDLYNRVATLKLAQVAPAEFECVPPRNHAEWAELGKQLEMRTRAFAPDDFSGMVSQFDGPTSKIQNAELRDFRLTGDGFRFVLNLQAGYKLDGPDLLNIQDWHPGEYVVEYDGSQFTVQPLSPAVLLIEQLGLASQGDTVQTLTWTTLQALVVNRGLEDKQNLLLCAYLEGPMGGREILTSTLTFLPGEGSQVVAWHWLPRKAGLWRFSATTDCGGVSEIESSVRILGETVVEVSDTAKPTVRWLVSIGGLVSEPMVLFLFAAVMVSAVVAAFCIRQTNV